MQIIETNGNKSIIISIQVQDGGNDQNLSSFIRQLLSQQMTVEIYKDTSEKAPCIRAVKRLTKDEGANVLMMTDAYYEMTDVSNGVKFAIDTNWNTFYQRLTLAVDGVLVDTIEEIKVAQQGLIFHPPAYNIKLVYHPGFLANDPGFSGTVVAAEDITVRNFWEFTQDDDGFNGLGYVFPDGSAVVLTKPAVNHPVPHPNFRIYDVKELPLLIEERDAFSSKDLVESIPTGVTVDRQSFFLMYKFMDAILRHQQPPLEETRDECSCLSL